MSVDGAQRPVYTDHVTRRQREVILMNRFSPERLCRIMAEAGMTQADLARKMGISRASLSRVLRGLRSPGSKFIAALKAAFPNTPMECFFDLDSSS